MRWTSFSFVFYPSEKDRLDNMLLRRQGSILVFSWIKLHYNLGNFSFTFWLYYFPLAKLILREKTLLIMTFFFCWGFSFSPCERPTSTGYMHNICIYNVAHPSNWTAQELGNSYWNAQSFHDYVNIICSREIFNLLLWHQQNAIIPLLHEVVRITFTEVFLFKVANLMKMSRR